MSPKGHEFNWVKARSECVLPLELERLKDSVKNSIQEIQELRSFDIREVSPKELWVYGKNKVTGSEYGVEFILRTNDHEGDHIAVMDYMRNTSFKITLALNDNGQCRYCREWRRRASTVADCPPGTRTVVFPGMMGGDWS